MRTLYTLLFAALSFGAFSQNNFIHVYPWNPDANQDNEIGMDDLLSFLSVFGEEFGLPPEPCTYDGTPLEEWSIEVFNGEIVIDSIFIEYQLENTVTYFIPGCPEAITDTITLSNYGMTYSPGNMTAGSWPTIIFSTQGMDAFNSGLGLNLLYNQSNNRYIWYVNSHAILDQYGADNIFGSFQSSSNTSGESLPWPDGWSLTEDGISIDWQNGWSLYANYLHILPYWHYADE